MKTDIEAARRELQEAHESCDETLTPIAEWVDKYAEPLLADVEELTAAIRFVLDNEMPDAKSQEEFGGYVLEDEVRITLEQALNAGCGEKG